MQYLLCESKGKIVGMKDKKHTHAGWIALNLFNLRIEHIAYLPLHKI